MNPPSCSANPARRRKRVTVRLARSERHQYRVDAPETRGRHLAQDLDDLRITRQPHPRIQTGKAGGGGVDGASDIRRGGTGLLGRGTRRSDGEEDGEAE
jgi:hypothetical protein